MALSRNNILDDSDIFSYCENDKSGGSPPSIQGCDQSSPQKSNKICQAINSASPINNVGTSNSSSSSPSSSNSSGLIYPTLKYHQTDEGNSISGFKDGYDGHSQNAHSSGSLLSFAQNEQFPKSSFSKMNNQDEFSIWEDNMHHDNHVPLQNGNGVQYGWMNLKSTPCPNSITDLGGEEGCLNKRPCEEESAQPPKKQCITSLTKHPKPKANPSKDPQSLAAKNRRERISERLKNLQELVPNGSKVDMVTMLEKAISYVKFLQLQVKILATDEFWPVQGGKAPELSKVQDVIDNILASQRANDRNSSSN